MYDPSYGREKLGQAVSVLVGRGHIKERLYRAWLDGLHVIRFQHHLPEDLRERFAELREAFTWLPAETPGEGTLPATLRAMSDEEAERLANRLLDMYVEVVRRTAGGEE